MANRSLLVSLALLLAVFIAFWPATWNNFLSWDDGVYVADNPHVREGLSVPGVVWAFTSLDYAANWHPLTWLSHMLDVTLFGLNPRGHHLISIGLHAGNTVLLFLVLRGMTGAMWRSALVAALFAVHPLRVESVAWVAERKDVLSTLFGLLATAAYGRYVRKRSLRHYFTVLGLFALGLLAKPMLVTLPCVFLLLDYWPLGRVRPLPRSPRTEKGGNTTNSPDLGRGRNEGLSLVLEKIPLFALAVVSAVIAWIAQSRGGGMEFAVPFRDRLSNAIVAYVGYLWKTVWPVHLAAYYPHPEEGLPAWRVLAAVLFLTAVTALVLWQRRRRPYLVTGWFWYLGTLVPVIGLVQVGEQAMADRYTYMPLIGIIILAAWSVPASILVGPWQRHAAIGAGALLLAGLMTLTWLQISHWRNDLALWEHAVAVTRGNWRAHNNLGAIYFRLGRDDEASDQYKEALRLQPGYAEAYNNLGVLSIKSGKLQEAQDYFRKAIQAKPEYEGAYSNLGWVFFRQGKLGEALEYFQEAVRRKADSAYAHFGVGRVLQRTGRLEEAMQEYRIVLRLNPDHKSAQIALREVTEITEIMKRNPDIR